MRYKKGFTLIELLAVIVILTIISVITTPIIVGIIEKSREKAFEEEARNIEKKETLRSAIEEKVSIVNTKVNGIQVNKVIGTKGEKDTIKNWVWYSGQLWQVMETTGSHVKLITANSVTSIAYGETNNWNTSWVRKWLNEIDENSNQDGIYYNNLTRKDILLEGKFCLDEPTNITTTDYEIEVQIRQKVTNFTPINTCGSISRDKIGLMTFEDYIYSLNGTDGITGALGNSYLDEGKEEWTMTQYTENKTITNRVWQTYYLTPSHIEKDWNTTASYGIGVRPVIYLSSEIMIEKNEASNYGTIANPYRLVIEIPNKSIKTLSSVSIGSYIYISEENSSSTATTETVSSRLSYTYDKTKVRYRVIGINSNGTVKIQRADVLRGLASSISFSEGTYVPYYYYSRESTSSCVYLNGTWDYEGCSDNNYFKPSQGSGTYAYTESENVGYYLNNATNSYYNWLSNEVKDRIVDTRWNLAVSGHGSDYVTSLFNTTTGGIYPSRTNDGTVEAKVGLPQYGDMFSGNDLNIPYWYINRHPGSSLAVSFMSHRGSAGNIYTNFNLALRPVITLQSNIQITSGDGTPYTPYILLFE